MTLAEHCEYREHTLLRFESHRTAVHGHWIIIAPDGRTVIAEPKLTEVEARATIDWILGDLS